MIHVIIDKDVFKVSRHRTMNITYLLSCEVTEFPDQCGMIILHKFYFTNNFREYIGKDRKKLLKEIKKPLKEEFKRNTGKLVASAVVNSTLDEFLEESGWQKSTMKVNPNSGNIIRLWSLNI